MFGCCVERITRRTTIRKRTIGGGFQALGVFVSTRVSDGVEAQVTDPIAIYRWEDDYDQYRRAFLGFVCGMCD
ncbi:Uncharacterised protein [Yersinia mollaretii]|nr:Uncharacterised protein [Yersinia mollaretii]CQH22158.1 Uncharacterised protein [Yersinia mollaretii]